jgi:hypothetical protein
MIVGQRKEGETNVRLGTQTGRDNNVRCERSHGIDWWVGSNGNLFGDHGGFRYCVARRGERYVIARNGVDVASTLSVADAKLWVSRD